MIKFYRKYLLPKLLDSSMRKEVLEIQRKIMIPEAFGVVLEIGFGSGLNIPYYKNISKLIALDPSKELYLIAEDRLKNNSFVFEYITSSAEKIPLLNNSVDSVVSTWTLCSILNPNLALREIFRVLKPGGKLIFIEHGKSSNKFVASLQKILNPFSKYFRGGCNLDREIDRLIISNGFNLENISKFQIKYRPFSYTYRGIASVEK